MIIVIIVASRVQLDMVISKVFCIMRWVGIILSKN